MTGYDFWKAALEDPSKIGSKKLPVHENDPQAGFYRMKREGSEDLLPVAIWDASGEMVAKVGEERTIEAVLIWTYVCRSPVTEADYRAVRAGGTWPDSAPKRGIGDNLPEDPFELLTIEFQGELEIAKELLSKPVKDQDQADKVANFAKRVSSLAKKADEHFNVEKRPLLEAAKACDNKWRDLREGLKNTATDLKRHLDAFLAEQRRIEQERQRKAAEDAAAARRAAEEAARKAENEHANPDDPEQIAAKEEADRLAAEAKAKEKEASEKTVTAGRTGSKVSMRTFKSAQITDYDKLVEALKGRDEMKELVQSLANRAAKSDIELPGMKIISEERAV